MEIEEVSIHIDKRGEMTYIDIVNTAPWPSGKAKVCNTSITSSNLVGAFGKNKPCACSFIMFAKTGEEK